MTDTGRRRRPLRVRMRGHLHAMKGKPVAINLKAVREAAGIMQKDVAKALGMSEKSGRVTVAQIEARSDWLVSSLAAYLSAVGASAELVVYVNDQELRFEL